MEVRTLGDTWWASLIAWGSQILVYNKVSILIGIFRNSPNEDGFSTS